MADTSYKFRTRRGLRRLLPGMLLCALLFSALLLPGCNLQKAEELLEGETVPQVHSTTFAELFDTVSTILHTGGTEEEFSKQSNELIAYLTKLNQLFDSFKEYPGVTNIYTINAHAGKGPLKVDPLILDLLEFSRDWYKKSDGAVDVAAGSVLKLWHDARITSTETPDKAYIPTKEELESAGKHLSWDAVKLDRSALSVEITDPRVQLNVGAVAKGYATELAAKWIEKKGWTNYLLNLGGNVRCVGAKSPKGLPWSVAVQNPNKNDPEPFLVSLKLKDLSLVTSGAYERYFVFKGKSYNHIIDPWTLFPADRYLSVSILTKDSGQADALSTALFILPIEEGKKVLAKVPGAEAYWVEKNGRQTMTPGFKKLVVKTFETQPLPKNMP